MRKEIRTRLQPLDSSHRAATRPSAAQEKPHRDGPAGWRHGSIDSGPRLEDWQVAAASGEIRNALLVGDWSEAIRAMLSARGEQIDTKGLGFEPNESAPALTDIEADYVAALAECHLSRTDLIVGAQELARLSRWTPELTESANDRAAFFEGKKFAGTAAKSLSARREFNLSKRIENLRDKMRREANKKSEVA
jgi:hypothetical protein